MGTGPKRRTRHAHCKKKGFKKSRSTKRRTKDLDELQEAFRRGKQGFGVVGVTKTFEYDPDLPGGGQFYCAETDRHFMDAKSLAAHKKTKAYKKQLKLLKEKQYTQAEADEAAGMKKEILPSAAEVRAAAEGRGGKMSD